jgi:hypothetical protein
MRTARLRIVKARDDTGLGRMPGNTMRRSSQLNAPKPINLFTLAPLVGAFFSFRKY